MDENMKKVPQIRFDGFMDTWEQRTIGEYGYFYYGKSAPKWSVTDDATTPCVRYGELYTKHSAKIDRVYSYTNIPKDNLKFSTGNEVLVPRVGEDPLDFANCSWLSIPNVAIGEMISVYNTKNNPLFTAYMFNALLRKEFAMKVEGGNVSNLYYSYLEGIKVSFPSIEEQNKITELLETLDRTITFYQRKLDLLAKSKKAYLQKMFPKNGKDKPEIRFDGFTDAWEQCRLIEIADYRNGKAHEQSIDENGKYIVINSKFVSTDGHVRKFSNSQIEPLHQGELAFVLSDVPNGKAIARTFLVDKNDKYSLNQRIAGITPHENTDSYFLNILMNRNQYFLKFDTGVGQTNLSKTDVEEFTERYPCKEEQQKIGSFFSTLDRTITFHQRELELLKKMKKSLLQKMFI